MAMPAGLRLADRLPEPMFTPSTKAEVGHDENIDFAAAASLVGGETAAQVAATSASPSTSGPPRRAAEAGLILADTKFELGRVDGRLVLCDEVVTPDSSRLWPADQVVPGTPPPAFDKQPLRDWAAPGPGTAPRPRPPLPQEVVAADLEPLRRRLRAGHGALPRRLVRSRVSAGPADSAPMRFAAHVEVRLRPGIADPESATIERALPALGFDDVSAP